MRRHVRDPRGMGNQESARISDRRKTVEPHRASDSDPSWAATLPLFATEIKRIFTAEELAAYFATTTRIGPAAHIATDEQYQTMRDAGALDLDDDVLRGAADAVLFERARVLLLGGATPL
jgi:hypothetical protein